MSSETPVQKALTDQGIDINTRDWVVDGGGTLVIGTATIFYRQASRRVYCDE